MKAYHLTESSMPQRVAIIFGRFNPPHKGHKHAWETASREADEWYVGTNRSTIGPEDPLPFEVKIEAMKAIMPEVEDHLVAEQTWWNLATYVFKKYGGVPGRTLPIELIIITDEPYVVPGLLKANGVPGRHGEYSFQDIRLPFENIEAAKKYLRISSATSLRDAVAQGDRAKFSQAAGAPADMEVAGHKFFDLVAHYLLPHRAAAEEKARQQAERDKQKAEKEKAKQEKAAAKIAKSKGPAQELAERSVSQKQARFMAAAAHDPEFAKKAGIKQSVAKEFNKADTGTKQLSNAMKNKRKKISEELNELYENRHGSIQDDVARALPAAYVMPGLKNQDAYNQYRFGLAIADVRGRKARENDAGNTKFQSASPWGENEIIVSFDPDIDKVIDAALAEVGQSSSGKKLITTPRSEEAKDVSKHSPVANIKRNKYGV